VSTPTARHGHLPPPPAEALLTDDPDLWLASGPLAPDLCECEALCECDKETE
jgi:hypothetical protein